MYDLLNTQACLSRDLWLPERRLLHYYVQKSDFSGHVMWRAEHSGLSAKPQEAKETQRIAEDAQGISGNTQQLTALGSEDQTLGHAQYTPLLCHHVPAHQLGLSQGTLSSQPHSLIQHPMDKHIHYAAGRHGNVGWGASSWLECLPSWDTTEENHWPLSCPCLKVCTSVWAWCSLHVTPAHILTLHEHVAAQGWQNNALMYIIKTSLAINLNACLPPKWWNHEWNICVIPSKC